MLRSLALLLLIASAPLAAQLPSMTPMATPTQPTAIPLGTGGVPGGAAAETWFRFGDEALVRNVTQATLTPVMPPAGNATGAAAIVAPGGAFMMLSMDAEGWSVARWLAAHGIAAFILKYRLRPTPADADAFGRHLGAVLSRPVAPGANVAVGMPEYAVADGAAALRLVRARAGEWGVDPRRVGMIGFSAGAMTTLQLALHASPADMPAFIAPIYGPMAAVDVPKDAPPLFATLAMGDPLFGKMGYGLIERWHAAGRPAELHVYQAGGHGFGLGRKGTTSVGWIAALRDWLAASGFLSAAK